MRNIFAILMMAALMLTAGCATTNTSGPEQELKKIEPLAYSARKTMAVVPYEFKDKNIKYSGLESGIVDLTINSFFETQRYLIVERTRLDSVMQELKFTTSGLVETTNALKLGKQVGAEFVFIGTVASISSIEHKKSVGFAWIQEKGFEVTLQGRIIDIERGVVVASKTVKGREVQKKKQAMGATTGSIAPDDTLIKTAMHKAVKLLTNGLASQM
jgi:curli biogenesis system outer membrane secretion channel CsgG